MENPHYEEKYKGFNIKIYQDEDYSASDDKDENRFLVGYHRSFWVEPPKDLFSKEELIAYFKKDKAGYDATLFKKYHVFALEAYIHSGVRLALANEGNFPDRQWDVSLVGAVLLAKEEWKTKAKAKKSAQSFIEYWNDVMSGNVWGYRVEDEEDNEVESCWGYVGDYDGKDGMLDEVKSIVDHLAVDKAIETKELNTLVKQSIS